MKKPVYASIMAMCAALALGGCQSAEPTATTVGGSGPNIAQAQQERYDGPKARIAVNQFVDKSAGGHGKLGQGMADMLTTALFQSNRYIVLDRTDHGAIMTDRTGIEEAF